MKVVLDTNIIVDHVRAEDRDCSNAIHAMKSHRHVQVVCEKLLGEYRGVLCQGNQQLYAVVDGFLRQMLPSALMLKQPDPQVRIGFGPLEDRFHLQLAIDARADYHVTKDKRILEESANMKRFSVQETHPHNYVISCDRKRASK